MEQHEQATPDAPVWPNQAANDHALRVTAVFGALLLTALTVAHTALMPPQTFGSIDFPPVEENLVYSLPLLAAAIVLGFFVGRRMQHDRLVLWWFVGAQSAVFVIGSALAAASIARSGGDLPNHGDIDSVFTALGLSAMTGIPALAAVLALAAAFSRTTWRELKAIDSERDALRAKGITHSVWIAVLTGYLWLLAPALLLEMLSSYRGEAPDGAVLAPLFTGFVLALPLAVPAVLFVVFRRIHSIVAPAFALTFGITVVGVFLLSLAGPLALPVMFVTLFSASFSTMPGLLIPIAVMYGMGHSAHSAERVWMQEYWMKHHPGVAGPGYDFGPAPLIPPAPSSTSNHPA